MIDYKKMQRQLWLFIALSIFGIVLVGAATVWLASTMGGLETESSLLLGLLISTATMLAVSNWLTHLATMPLHYIRRTINDLTSETTDKALPDPANLSLGRELTRSILKDIFDLSASQHETQKTISSDSEFMHALVDQVSAAVIAIDRNKMIKFANQRGRELIGNYVEKPLGAEFEKALPLEFQSENTLYAWLASSEANTVQSEQTWQRVKLTDSEGSVRYFDMVAHFSKAESHGIETVVALTEFTDIYTNDSREVAFVSLAVHELRSLVTLLRGYIEVFEDEIGPELGEDHRGFMNKMDVTAAQLSTFVNNILNVSRIESEQMVVHMKKESWLSILNNAADDLRMRAEVRGRHLKLKLPDKLPEVAVDRISIYEVLSNLIDNAVKYSKPDGEITLATEVTADGFVETTITDNGIGVPANLMPHLFDKFYRSHRSRENIGGTGLGLYLSKKIVEAHGGSIWCKSKEGEGATFGFTINPFETVAEQVENGDNKAIVSSAHGWIINHKKVRR